MRVIGIKADLCWMNKKSLGINIQILPQTTTTLSFPPDGGSWQDLNQTCMSPPYP